MEIKWIQDFLSLAEHGSFSRSAIERSVTQSALSRRIRALEAWIGVELVDRSTYPIRLTPAGKVFHEQAQLFLRQLMETRALLQAQTEKPN
jgi:DNA-binding transcriptional LysR family regulator